jgi:Lamin Tail Domain/Concanavalin A-like lectin/glucanases superfamily
LKSLLTLLATAAVATAADSVLVFNELNYHPANEATETEWIEFRSLQAVDVDISGWRIDGGVDFVFPAGTIVPGHSYLVVAATPAQIPGALGPFTGQLDNGGETLRLRNRMGRIMDELSYDDEGAWPAGPDGGGVTLARRNASAAGGAEHWSPSRDLGGTPGAANFAAVGTANVRTRRVAIGDTWRFLDDGTTPPANWNAAGFDDTAWKTGATLITGGGVALARTTPADFPGGLIAFWSFDETSGSTADNAVAGQPDGTMANGAAFVNDSTRGRVAEFDGADDRMEVIDSGTSLPSVTFLPAMTTTNDFTWAAWVWSPVVSSAADQAGGVILGNRTGPGGTSTTPIEFIKMTPTQFQYFRNGAAEHLDYADLATNAWTHMCVVKRGLNLDYYRNGAFLQTRSLTQGIANALTFYVGGDRRSGSPTQMTGEHFQGRVDDVGLWTRALSAPEIAGLSSGYGVTPPLPAPPEQTANATTGAEPRYFRKAFTFPGVPARTTLELWPIADDGAVIYLNGVEIWRNNVPVSSEVSTPAFATAPVVIPATALVQGTNVLSAEVHQHAANSDLLFGADLLTEELPVLPPDAAPTLVFSEISAAGDAGFFLELQNQSSSAITTSGWSLTTSAGSSFALPAQNIPPGGHAVFTAASLGFTPADGLRLQLFAPGGTEFHDARAITARHRGLTADGRWGHPDGPTPGATNVTTVSDAIVINEIFYNAVNNGPEQWIELHNKSASPVDVSLWKFSDGISYQFAAGTPAIPAGGFVVVAWDTAAFAALHPGVTALGPFGGSLSGSGETLTLRDANDNVADQLTYYDGGRWSQWADGGGSSLELTDPRADNSRGESWDASDESGKSTWQTVTYGGQATNTPSNNPTTWNEFTFGLLNGGEFLIDDISVKDATQGNVELIQNGTFGGGTANFWRIIGTHSGSIVPDPGAPANNVLKVAAQAETEHMHNHATTTLKNGAAFHTIVATDTYNISFRAKWLRGSNALHTRLYANRLPRKTLLNRPATGGTPGAVNSRFVANTGPTFDALSHSPAVPAASQPASVTVRISDADGIGSVQLFTSINGAAFTSSAMTTAGDGIYAGVVPGQSAAAVVQFYVRATDTAGAASFFPAGGPASRAMIQWADGRAQLTLASGAKPHNLRVIMPGADANTMYRHEFLMSNAAIPCTVILDESVIYYRAGVSLKSSEHGRFEIARVGYNIEFPPDDLFLGTHGGIAIDRSGGVVTGQSEILLKQLTNLAGGMHAPEDDLARIIPSVASGTGFMFDGSGMLGSAILSKTRLKRDYLDNQWDNGGDGMMFKYERVYVLTQTINAATRVVDGAIVPENPKIPQSSTAPPGVGVVNLGANTELYRWHWLVESGRDADNYTGLVNLLTAIGQTGGTAAFNTQVEQHIDVSTWLRAHVPPALYGVTDNYMAPTGSGQHNVLFYFPPGKKAVAFFPGGK